MKLHEKLGISLSDIDAALLEVVNSDEQLVMHREVKRSISSLIRSGGKRLRPIMALVGSRFGHADDPMLADRAMRTAVMLEYLHMASLIHDDIIDDADTRRGEPSVHRKTDVRTAVFIANYMMIRAVEWACEGSYGSAGYKDESAASHAEQCAELAALVTELCQGEYSQLENRYAFHTSIDSYLDKTRSKTALLMASAMKAGAAAAEADSAVCDTLYSFGEALGMAFQIRDDMLDFTRTSEELGKPSGSDLRSGNVTLPVLYALEDAVLAEKLRRLHAASPSADFDEALELIRSCGAIDRTEALCQSYLRQAEAAAARLSEHPAHPQLQTLLSYFVS